VNKPQAKQSSTITERTPQCESFFGMVFIGRIPKNRTYFWVCTQSSIGVKPLSENECRGKPCVCPRTIKNRNQTFDHKRTNDRKTIPSRETKGIVINVELLHAAKIKIIFNTEVFIVRIVNIQIGYLFKSDKIEFTGRSHQHIKHLFCFNQKSILCLIAGAIVK